MMNWMNPDGLHEVSIMTCQNQRFFQIPQTFQGKNPKITGTFLRKKTIKKQQKITIQGHHLLVGGFNPSEKY